MFLSCAKPVASIVRQCRGRRRHECRRCTQECARHNSWSTRKAVWIQEVKRRRRRTS